MTIILIFLVSLTSFRSLYRSPKFFIQWILNKIFIQTTGLDCSFFGISRICQFRPSNIASIVWILGLNSRVQESTAAKTLDKSIEGDKCLAFVDCIKYSVRNYVEVLDISFIKHLIESWLIDWLVLMACRPV